VGAGLQLSPNATRILRDLGVLDAVLSAAGRPEDVRLVDATDLSLIARVQLGRFAEERWGAPYLVAHRADLHRALLASATEHPRIRIVTGVSVTDASFGRRVSVSVRHEGQNFEAEGDLLVGADGVWSGLRQSTGLGGPARFSGDVAWRSLLPPEVRPGAIASPASVTVVVHPRFHLVAYPLGSGALNLVAVTSGSPIGEEWSVSADPAPLAVAVTGCAPAIRELVRSAQWTAWPICTSSSGRWIREGRLALIGDAAHAMSPFLAQGAAMAIEDAATLADAFVKPGADRTETLHRWEQARQTRLARVARRGRFNRFAWNATGVVALARNLVLRTRSAEQLAADLDWLYGWRG
jgi:salicylate hydroxylase